MSNFFSLEIGKRSVLMHQTALSITGHNIANANTPGYTRQVADIVTTPPWHAPSLVQSGKPGQLGTGVEIAAVNRVRDEFIDTQIRHENKAEGYWAAMQNTLAKIEVILNEPTEDGLRGVMDMFWESWQDLSLHPESEAVRAVVVQRGMSLAEAFNHTHRQLVELREDVNAQVKVKVNEVNSIAMQIADLNKQILAVTISGKRPNDLLDKRDLLIDDLSRIADVKVFTDKNNMVTLQLGDRVLVEGKDYNRLGVNTDQEMYMVIWEDTQTRAKISSGELRGLLDARGRSSNPQEANPSEYKEIIPNMIADLNSLAKTIITKTNDIHRSGYSLNNNDNSNYLYPDGRNFFNQPVDINDSVDWAKFMSLNDEIINDLKNIAVAARPTWGKDPLGNLIKANFGDGGVALDIAQLKHYLNDSEWRIDSSPITDLAVTSFSFDIDGVTIIVDNTVTPPDPAPIQNMYDLAVALQEQIDGTALKGKIMVRSNGNQLTFYSNSNSFTLDTGTAVQISGKINQVTTDDYWRSVCADIGVLSQESQRVLKNQEVLLNELENKRQSISGVSLDEEMTNMIRFQHAYNAAARFITSIDEAMEVVINRMGLVGR
ncbi:MAG TPA: flagellar hook-associated protein FlgK [Syntrophomonas sp.]|jgi:flagellar hook-associated protein 1 FlgK|nr:flagellar hook-associated protein FlgK [Syntrophomonas sp.]